MNKSQLVALARVRRMIKSGEAKAIRIENGLSLAEMGSCIGKGVGPGTVWRWEEGQRIPRGELGLAYLAALEALILADSA